MSKTLPTARLHSVPRLQFPANTDCNSPAFWRGGTLYLFNSAGHPYRASGRSLFELGPAEPVAFDNTLNGGRWIESVWLADDGVLYGWYHHEPIGLCPGTSLTAPKIGAARSEDNGATWIDLGFVLEARANTLRCDARNGYFAGGNGDFCVFLDPEQHYLYFFFGSYAGDVDEQGVCAARMEWKHRDAPVGNVWKWYRGKWTQPGLGGNVTPFLRAFAAWEREDCDAFWGPSVHWNAYLHQYVMLLNRARGAGWAQEGIYISFSPDLADPESWSQPEKVLDGGAWYPQVIGLQDVPGGTDKLAGQRARFFMGGVSEYEIEFVRPEQ